MSSSVGFYVKPNILIANSIDDDDIFDIEEDNEEFDSQGYLYEVPYTSSSIDRCSVGSIPWADDAIKINKMEWNKVEKMLSGLESLPAAENDLSKEIVDWQNKFPQLLKRGKHEERIIGSESLDMESLPSLVLTSDDDGDTEENITLTRDLPTNSKFTGKPVDDSNLCQLMDNFTLKSVPFSLSQREPSRTIINKRKCTSSTSSYSLRSPPTPMQNVPSVATATNRFRMPPILNVLQSTKKFRNLRQNKNPSFVQLTQIQQAKSAVASQEQKSFSHVHTAHRSAWHVPLAANRFSNNRNSIILPSISTKRYTKQPTTTSGSSDAAISNSISSSIGKRTNLLRTNNKNNNLMGLTTNVFTQTSSSKAASGRSISAAVKYPRFNALYLPYCASKLHPFN